MDEASSRFVDQIAIEKLVREKLAKVHHFPTVRSDEVPADLFNDFRFLKKNASISVNAHSGSMKFPSPVSDDYPENRYASVISYKAKNPRATILLVHGLFEDSRDIYAFMIKGLNRAGYSVAFLTLPYHYDRKPKQSLFSGEYFWSADIIRTQNAFKQAVYELYQIHNWLIASANLPVFIVSFSMGAAVALTLATLFDGIRGIFAINPASALSDIIWDSPLCSTIKDDFFSAGYTLEDLKKTYARFEPISAGNIITSPDAICMAFAAYDLVTDQVQYQRLIDKWKLKNVLSYKAGHLNTLRVPRLADDITFFFDSRMMAQ